ncbi:hypothetical protein RJT34_01536 [Clitoria ternatea]|uniref:Uncharacterized protein n=1 Tax=Clitoria ternatea TaxID=43366 RepID=A0AAN9Q1A5_CLITE
MLRFCSFLLYSRSRSSSLSTGTVAVAVTILSLVVSLHKTVRFARVVLTPERLVWAIGRGKVTTPAQAQEVNYALKALYYVCNGSNKEKILKPEVVDLIKRYVVAEEVSVSFSNLAKAFLDKHLSRNQ